MQWGRRTIFIQSHNRYVDAIMQGDKFIIECGCLSELYTSHLISCHNEAIDEKYKIGLTEGATIAKDVYKGV